MSDVVYRAHCECGFIARSTGPDDPKFILDAMVAHRCWCDRRWTNISKTLDGMSKVGVKRVGDTSTKPDYYRSQNGMDVIDVIHKFGLGFMAGNILKYIVRAGRKPGTDALDDLLARFWVPEQGTIPERRVSCMACGGAGVRHFCELPDDEQCSACNGRGYRNG